VLFYGILGALVFRGIFIALGSALLQFGWVIILFGIFLVFTGVKMMLGREQQIEPEKSWSMRLIRRIVPVTSDLAGQNLLARIGGRLHATPLAHVCVFAL
jgi:tellurite resistance protein TerC